MDLRIHRVRRLVITEKMEPQAGTIDHCFLIIQTQSGEILKIDLYDWNGEIENETWMAGVLA